MPRPTLYRRLSQLIAHDLVEKQGQNFVMRIDALSKPKAVQEFKRRVSIIQQAAQKLSELDKYHLPQH